MGDLDARESIREGPGAQQRPPWTEIEIQIWFWGDREIRLALALPVAAGLFFGAVAAWPAREAAPAAPDDPLPEAA